MLTYTNADMASKNIEKMIDEVNKDKQILISKSDGKCAVLVSLAEYNSLKEKTYKELKK